MNCSDPILFPTQLIKRFLTTVLESRTKLSVSDHLYYEFNHHEALKKSKFGHVYCGQQVVASNESKYIAVKTISNHRLGYSELSQLVEGENPFKEFCALNFIQSIGGHPGIVTSIDFLEDENLYYHIMELIKGHDMFDFMRSNLSVTESDIKTYFKQIVEAIKFINQHGIVHRDLSLENIMITTDLQIKIIDFGMCLRFSLDCADPQEVYLNPQGCVGKQSFVSPEIFENAFAFNPMFVDIWSVGVVLFAMIAKSLPFGLPTRKDVCYRYIAANRLNLLVQHWKVNIHKDAVTLIQAMLQVNAAKRIKFDDVLSHCWLAIS